MFFFREERLTTAAATSAEEIAQTRAEVATVHKMRFALLPFAFATVFPFATAVVVVVLTALVFPLVALALAMFFPLAALAFVFLCATLSAFTTAFAKATRLVPIIVLIPHNFILRIVPCYVRMCACVPHRVGFGKKSYAKKEKVLDKRQYLCYIINSNHSYY